MTLIYPRLTWFVLVNSMLLACTDELLHVDPETEEADSSEENAAASGAGGASGSAQPETSAQSEPLRPSPDAEAPAHEPSQSDGDAGESSDAAQNQSGGSGGAAPVGPPDPERALPDLVLDADYLEATIQQSVVDASLDSCLINEKCITGMGLRRVVRFGTRSGNIGTADLVAGRPALDNPVWEYDECHDHFHFDGYAAYELISATTSSVLPIGVKHGFCLRDLGSWDGRVSSQRCGVYDCDYQGLSIGCYDVYVPELDCQWVDITDVAPGDYDLRVTINSEQRILELDTSNNSASVRIRITPDTVQVVR